MGAARHQAGVGCLQAGRWPFNLRRVTVVGLGRTGRALVDQLARWGVDVFVTEARELSAGERAQLTARQVRWEEGGHTEAALDCDLMVSSPGVPPHAPPLCWAAARNITVWSEVELAFRLADPGVVIAVTGTDGKSTTCSLVGAILASAGLEPVVAGNIGRPAVSTVAEVAGRPWVLEVSSYQLEWTEVFRPHVAVWLNFAPDHLDHHRSLAAYFAAKARILARQCRDDVAVMNAAVAARLAPRGRLVTYPEIRLPPGWKADIAAHLLLDLQAAWSAACAVRPALAVAPPPFESVRGALAQPNRLEVVGTLGGITFINDSKATNAHATGAALRALPGPLVLILGGRHKGIGYDDLAPLLRAKVRSCVLVGEAQEFFARLLDGWGVPYVRAGAPADALAAAYRAANPGDTVLLSPACASFDQFNSYAQRGAAYRAAFAQLSRRFTAGVR
ncbi:MAG: Mur ligase family protein [Candidatus Bipolaricaulaceae bacterium]